LFIFLSWRIQYVHVPDLAPLFLLSGQGGG